MSPQAGSVLLNEVAPRLRAYTRGLKQVGADDGDELCQDGIALAAQMLDSAERRGKAVSAGNVAWYAARQLAAGRRSTWGGRTDALCPAAQLDGKAGLTSLQAEVAHDPESGEGIALEDLLADSADDPAEAACRNLDWEQFLTGLDDLSRRMVVAFARGETMRTLKMDSGLSDSGMSGRKRRLAGEMKGALGADCLADAGREPAWRADVDALREKDACRHDHVAV